MKKHIVYGLSFLIPLSIYIFTLCPTVYIGDSGEFISAAYTLGITHPPSSPPWCLLTKLFTYLPIYTVAWRVNFSSAVYAAAACLFLCILVHRITDSLAASLFSCLLFAIIQTTWSYAVVAKNYSLVALFSILLLLFLYLWETTSKRGYLYSAFFILGIGITTHHIMLPLIPALISLVVYRRLKYKVNFSFALSVLFLLAGLIFYIYLPLRARANPPINCGDPSNLTNFLYTISRTQFGRQGDAFVGVSLPIKQSGLFSFARLSSAFKTQNQILIKEFGWLFFALGITGAIFLFRKKRGIFYLSAVSFLGSLYVFLWLTNSRVYGFSHTFVVNIPGLIIFCLWLGFAVSVLLNLCRANLLFKVSEKPLETISETSKRALLVFRLFQSSLFKYGIIIMVFLNLFLLYGRNYHFCNKRGCFLAYDYGMNVLNSLEKDAVLFSEGADITGILAYLKVCENKRPDVLLIDRLNNLLTHFYSYSPDLGFQDVERARFKEELRLIHSTHRPVYYIFDSFRSFLEIPGIELRQTGLVYRVVRDKPGIGKGDLWARYRMRGIDNPDFLNESGVAKLVSEYYWHKGRFFREQGDAKGARENFMRAAKINNQINEYVSYTLAQEFIRMNRYQDAVDELKKGIAVNDQASNLYYLLGHIYINLSEDEKAIDTFNSLVKIRPVSSAYDKLASLYYNKGYLKEARENALSSLKLNTKNDLPYTVLGLVYLKENKKIEAQREFEQALAINPGNLTAKEAKDSLGE